MPVPEFLINDVVIRHRCDERGGDYGGLPPSSIFLAEPKKRLGVRGGGSIPPLNVLPLGGTVVLYALASLVRLSNTICTFFIDQAQPRRTSSAI